MSLRGGQRPTWRPEREARGSALGVQSREGTYSLHRLPIKTYDPIASVAALSERHGQLQIWRHSRRMCNASKFVIARPQRGRGNLGKALPEWERHRRPYTPPDLTVAAFPAQPLAALPPYGCGVPLAGCERLAGWQVIGRHRRMHRFPDLSLRGPEGAVAP